MLIIMLCFSILFPQIATAQIFGGGGWSPPKVDFDWSPPKMDISLDLERERKRLEAEYNKRKDQALRDLNKDLNRLQDTEQLKKDLIYGLQRQILAGGQSWLEDRFGNIAYYKTNKFDKKDEVRRGGWQVAFGKEINETHLLEMGTAYAANGAAGNAYVQMLIKESVQKLQTNGYKLLHSSAKKEIDRAVSEVISRALRGRFDAHDIIHSYNVDIKFGAIQYSGGNYFNNQKIGPSTFGMIPYVAVRYKNSVLDNAGRPDQGKIERNYRDYLRNKNNHRPHNVVGDNYKRTHNNYIPQGGHEYYTAGQGGYRYSQGNGSSQGQQPQFNGPAGFPSDIPVQHAPFNWDSMSNQERQNWVNAYRLARLIKQAIDK